MTGLKGIAQQFRAKIRYRKERHDEDNPMIRILLLATIAVSLIVPVASVDAGNSKKHRYYRYQANGPVVYQQYGAWQAPAGVRRRGPPWAMPNECFNDEGYGRWSPCGGRDH